MIEAQIAHVINALRFMKRHGYASVEPKAAAQEAFVAEVDRKSGSRANARSRKRATHMESVHA